MKRAERLDHFRDGLESSEKEHRARLAAAQAKVGDARGRLAELERYRDEYVRGLERRVAGGMSGQGRDELVEVLEQRSEAVSKFRQC